MRRHEGILPRLAVFQKQRRCKLARTYAFQKCLDHGGQKLGVIAAAAGKLAAYERRETGKAVHQSLIQRLSAVGGRDGGVKAGYFRNGLGKVAAAALVHVAASLLAAVYDILDILFIDAGVLYGAYQRDNA